MTAANRCRWWQAAGLLAAACVGLAVAGGVATRPTSQAAFSPDAYLEHIKYLASDELGGRQPGTEGIELAAEYIAGHFARAGLKPAGDDGGYFQSFEVGRGKKLVDSEAMLKVEGVERTWKVREDWIPLPFSEMGEVEGPLAFAGYGIKATVYDYNDYADFDATGKVLLILRFEPSAEDPDAEFGGKIPSRHALFSTKAETAAKRGAKALLIVDPPKREGADDTLYAFGEELSEQTYDLPMVHVKRELADALLRKGGLSDLATLQEKLDKERKSLSADLNLRVKLRTGLHPNRFRTRNVVGLLPGTGETDEAIVIGAHYDHLGRLVGKDGTARIYNGADDNASGTAGVIELAHRLAGEPRLRRNLIFVAFSAEEMGLLGSDYFVDHPPVDLAMIKVMINLDMIGRLRDGKFTVYGLSSGKGMAELAGRAAEQAGLSYRVPAGGIFDASDHASFYHRGIPVVFPFTGIHKQYHQPEDDWELIDAEGATRVLTMLHLLIRDLGNLLEGPFFEPVPPAPPEEEPFGEPGKDEAGTQPADHAEQLNQSAQAGADGEIGKRSRPRSRLGIVPDFAADGQPGVVVGSLIEGGGAEAAGLQVGDRIIRIDEKNVRDIYSYMDALREAQPGQTVEVVVVRQDRQLKFGVTLKESPKPRGAE